MRLETETAHRFWLGRASRPILIAQGKVRVRGSSGQMLRLPTLLKPGYALYPQIWYLSDYVRLEIAYGYGSLNRFNTVGKTHFFQTRIQLQL